MSQGEFEVIKSSTRADMILINLQRAMEELDIPKLKNISKYFNSPCFLISHKENLY